MDFSTYCRIELDTANLLKYLSKYGEYGELYTCHTKKADIVDYPEAVHNVVSIYEIHPADWKYRRMKKHICQHYKLANVSFKEI